MTLLMHAAFHCNAFQCNC